MTDTADFTMMVTVLKSVIEIIGRQTTPCFAIDAALAAVIDVARTHRCEPQIGQQMLVAADELAQLAAVPPAAMQ